MGRNVSSGSVIRAQADFYVVPGSASRVTGILSSDISLSTFFNNSILPWPIADGTSVPDSSISAGTVYFNEMSGSSGFYTVRFFPDRTGFWRLVLKNIALNVEVILEFDISAPTSLVSGLNATFSK